MKREHHYSVELTWTGNQGTGTSKYSAYSRDCEITVEGKPTILASADPSFRGDKTRYNPEELLVASLSTCHMLSYLYLCSVNGVVVVAYKEKATGTLEQTPTGGRFTAVTLRPEVVVSETIMIEKAIALHKKAGEACFIASSCNFPIDHEPLCVAE